MELRNESENTILQRLKTGKGPTHPREKTQARLTIFDVCIVYLISQHVKSFLTKLEKKVMVWKLLMKLPQEDTTSHTALKKYSTPLGFAILREFNFFAAKPKIGKIVNGEKVFTYPILDLMKKFNKKRTAIKDALRQLKKSGLIKCYEKNGCRNQYVFLVAEIQAFIDAHLSVNNSKNRVGQPTLTGSENRPHIRAFENSDYFLQEKETKNKEKDLQVRLNEKPVQDLYNRSCNEEKRGDNDFHESIERILGKGYVKNKNG